MSLYLHCRHGRKLHRVLQFDVFQGPPLLLFWGFLEPTRLSRRGSGFLPSPDSPTPDSLSCHSRLRSFCSSPTENCFCLPPHAKFSQASIPSLCPLLNRFHSFSSLISRDTTSRKCFLTSVQSLPQPRPKSSPLCPLSPGQMPSQHFVLIS